jgi:hypothetical protein
MHTSNLISLISSYNLPIVIRCNLNYWIGSSINDGLLFNDFVDTYEKWTFRLEQIFSWFDFYLDSGLLNDFELCYLDD